MKRARREWQKGSVVCKGGGDNLVPLFFWLVTSWYTQDSKFSGTGSSVYELRAAECNNYRNLRFSVLSDKNEVQS